MKQITHFPLNIHFYFIIYTGYEFNALTILRIEQGKRFVPDYEAVALTKLFQVSCEYLLGRGESLLPSNIFLPSSQGKILVQT